MLARLIGLALLLAVQEKETAAQYYPLVAGSVYEYKGAFNGKEFKDVYVLKTETIGDLSVTYYHRDGSSLVGNAWIGLGAFRINKDALETFDVSMLNKLATLKAADAQLLLPAALKEGFETTVKGYGGEMDLKLVVKGREDVTVAAGTYKNCVKIELAQVWPKKDKSYTGTSWLASGVGLVKRVHFTGRVDELVSVKIPGR